MFIIILLCMVTYTVQLDSEIHPEISNYNNSDSNIITFSVTYKINGKAIIVNNDDITPRYVVCNRNHITRLNDCYFNKSICESSCIIEFAYYVGDRLLKYKLPNIEITTTTLKYTSSSSTSINSKSTLLTDLITKITTTTLKYTSSSSTSINSKPILLTDLISNLITEIVSEPKTELKTKSIILTTESSYILTTNNSSTILFNIILLLPILSLYYNIK